MESSDLQAGYKEMSQDVEHETEALEWCETLIEDVSFDDSDNKD
jgi:hypothetical protein